jgi:hypothetical protein
MVRYTKNVIPLSTLWGYEDRFGPPPLAVQAGTAVRLSCAAVREVSPPPILSRGRGEPTAARDKPSSTYNALRGYPIRKSPSEAGVGRTGARDQKSCGTAGDRRGRGLSSLPSLRQHKIPQIPAQHRGAHPSSTENGPVQDMPLSVSLPQKIGHRSGGRRRPSHQLPSSLLVPFQLNLPAFDA